MKPAPPLHNLHRERTAGSAWSGSRFIFLPA